MGGCRKGGRTVAEWEGRAPQHVGVFAALVLAAHRHLVCAARENHGAQALARERHLQAAARHWHEVQQLGVQLDGREGAAGEHHRLHAHAARNSKENSPSTREEQL